MNADQDFGTLARELRRRRGFGLRAAAKQLGISAAFLSRVENGDDPPSAGLMTRMTSIYDCSLEELAAVARRRSSAKSSRITTAEAHGRALQASAELRALYRLGSKMEPERVHQLLAAMLKDLGHSDDEIEEQIAKLKDELPRLSRSRQDNLFASGIAPRFLSKRQIEACADEILRKNGLAEADYLPPTPIELIVENEGEIDYRIEELKSTPDSEPIVLGLSGFTEEGRRQIVVSSRLADSQNRCDEHRFNFTVAHEFFHAIEHLPLCRPRGILALARTGALAAIISETDILFKPRLSPAQRAVAHWVKPNSGPRHLFTAEDWREWQANYFASCILMPASQVEKEFRKRVGEPSIIAPKGKNAKEWALEIAGEWLFETAIHEKSMADLFGVSRQAMAIRLLNLGFIKEEEAKK